MARPLQAGGRWRDFIRCPSTFGQRSFWVRWPACEPPRRVRCGSPTSISCGIVSPSIQWPADPVKSETSRTPVPIPRPLALELSAAVKRWQGVTVVSDEMGRPCSPWELQRAMRRARAKVDGLPECSRYHDLRLCFASLLIASGADVKVVQKRLRHASAMTTLNTYGHMWPDADECTRVAIAAVLAARAKVQEPEVLNTN